MRAFTVAATILAGSFTLASAIPAGHLAARGECCCCDEAKGVVSCMTFPGEAYCRCASTNCPADAPTVWVGEPTPIPTPTPAPAPVPEIPQEEQSECCCCDVSLEAIVCTTQNSADGCFCPTVMCPADAPTLRDDPPAEPAVTIMPVQDVAARQVEQVEQVVEKTQCCCCDILRGANVCSLRAPEDCYCAAVECPADAPTVWEVETPSVTTPAPFPTYTFM